MSDDKQARYAKMEKFANLLEDVVKDIKPEAEFSWRKMFGGAGYYVDGVMFAGWYDSDNIGLKLSEAHRDTLLKMKDAEQGMGKNTVNIPKSFLDDTVTLKTWVSKSLDYAASRPAKKKK